jgi:hypothetical protein
MRSSCKIGKNNMRHLKTYEHFQTNENVFGNLLSKIGDKIKTLRGKAFIKLMRTLLPKPILSEIDKIVGVKESYVILELFDYSNNINWEKMSQEEIDDFLKYFSKSQNFVSSIENPDKIISSTGNKEILNILKERGIDVPVQIVSKNTPDLKNILSKVDSLNVPTFVKGFLKVAACVVLFGMISFKLASGIPSGETDSNFSDLDSEHDHNHSVSDAHDHELLDAAEKAGVDFSPVDKQVVSSDKNFLEKIKIWICELLGIDDDSEEKSIDFHTAKYYKKLIELEKSRNDEFSDFENLIDETKNIVKAQVSVDKNIPDDVKKHIYDKIDACNPTFLEAEKYEEFIGKGSSGIFIDFREGDKFKYSISWAKEDKSFIFIKYSNTTLDNYKRTLIHELFHLVDHETDNEWGVSKELVSKGYWDFLKIQKYDDKTYNDNFSKIFGKDPSTTKYDKNYIMGDEEEPTFHEAYAHLKTMKNDLVKVGLLDSVEDPVSPELLKEILNGDHKDKLGDISNVQWKLLLPFVGQDSESVNKFSKFLSQVVDEPNKFDNLA